MLGHILIYSVIFDVLERALFALPVEVDPSNYYRLDCF
jgi:hypothetical protein